MFRTFLLASFAGSSAAANLIPSDLTARANYNTPPPSYFCNSAAKKCSSNKEAAASVTAYCSSLLRIPKTATKTKTVTKCAATTTKTKVTSTKTVGTAETVTSTISLCATPLATPRGGGVKVKREAVAAYYGGGELTKPACLAAYKKQKSISSACSCFPIKPKATTTTTVTSYTTKTVVVKTDTTVPATSTTVFITGTSLPFVVADYDVKYFAYGGQGKLEASGIGLNVFDAQNPFSDAILFDLDAATGRISVSPNSELDGSTQRDGFTAVRTNDPAAEGSELEASRVSIENPNADDFLDRFTPLTCSISQNPVDQTCPLLCRTQIGDVNQVGTVTDDQSGETYRPWYLGQPGEKSDDTYITYAVTRGTRTNRARKYKRSMGRIRRN